MGGNKREKGARNRRKQRFLPGTDQRSVPGRNEEKNASRGKSVLFLSEKGPEKKNRSFFSRNGREPRNRRERWNSVENRMRFSTEFPGSLKNCRQFSEDGRKKKALCLTEIAGNFRGTNFREKKKPFCLAKKRDP